MDVTSIVITKKVIYKKYAKKFEKVIDIMHLNMYNNICR